MKQVLLLTKHCTVSSLAASWGLCMAQQPPTDAITVAALFVSTLHSLFFYYYVRLSLCSVATGFLLQCPFVGLVFIWLHDIYFLVYCCTSVWNLCATTAFSARANRHYQSLSIYIYIYIYFSCPQHPNLCSDRHEQLFLNRCFNGRRTYFAGKMRVVLFPFFFFFFLSSVLHASVFLPSFQSGRRTIKFHNGDNDTCGIASRVMSFYLIYLWKKIDRFLFFLVFGAIVTFAWLMIPRVQVSNSSCSRLFCLISPLICSYCFCLSLSMGSTARLLPTTFFFFFVAMFVGMLGTACT